jgi:MoaA/NifB/PqqE/SkfB family radical SAM enzyme
MSYDLEKYLNDKLEMLVKNALKVTLKNPKQGAFFMRFTSSYKKAEKRRHELERNGEHVPSFLIVSITEDCNLNCAGCYSHANEHENNTCEKSTELNAAVWGRIFDEAEELGISAILMAGGEPLLRQDVIAEAAKRKNLMFPVISNGIFLDDSTIHIFDSNRNLIPIISIEGDETATDSRRGGGVYRQAVKTMDRLRERGILFGASITVTSANLYAVTDTAFLYELEQAGCKAVLFVEYVPVESPDIALDTESREHLASRVEKLRASQEGMIFISFPGDEAESGGCLAAGRGFFHISASGAAEPCPFSPYSDLNLRDSSLRDALKSPLFVRLRDGGYLATKHIGGCVLFEQEEAVRQLAGAETRRR